MPALAQNKRAARQALRAIRAGLPESDIRDASAAICGRILTLPELSGTDEVHCFWPRQDTPEIDIRPVIHQLLGAGRSVYLPVVVQAVRRSTDGPRILEAPLQNEETLEAGPWGIPQPDAHSARRLLSGIAIVPGLGVGQNATRVGQGWGFYDELLNQSDPLVVLPCFDSCILGAVEANDSDVPPGVVVTETRVLRNHGGKLV